MKHSGKISLLACGALLGAATLSLAAEAPAENGAAPEVSRQRMEEHANPELQKRRYEIMILLQAYRIVPDELKPGLKTEIIRRMREDYTANRSQLAIQIARLEKRLERLKSENKAVTPEEIDALMEHEFERLLSTPVNMEAPPPPSLIRGRVRGNDAGWPPPPAPRR